MNFCLFGSTVDRQLATDEWSGGSRAWLPLLLDLSCGLSSAVMSLRAEPTARRSKSTSSASCRAKASSSVPPSHRTVRSVNRGALSRYTGAPRDAQWWNRAPQSTSFMTCCHKLVWAGPPYSRLLASAELSPSPICRYGAPRARRRTRRPKKKSPTKNLAPSRTTAKAAPGRVFRGAEATEEGSRPLQ